MTAHPSAPLDVTVFGCDLDEAELFRQKAPRLGITPVITAAAVSDATIDLAAGSRCISVGHKSPIATSHLSRLSQAGVQYISTRSIGRDHLDVEYAQSLGITVESVAYSPDSVADYTLMLLLMALRHAKSTLRRVEAHDYRPGEARGLELRDLTVGVVGTGRIGAAVIDRLRGFGCRILAHDRQQRVPAEHVSLDELLRRSDVVTLHTPLDASTRHLLDRERLGLMKRGACLINTGRGQLVDTAALVDALESGALGGAALDVLEEEQEIFYADRRKRPPQNPAFLRLHELPNAIITPHTAYFTAHALSDIVANSLINCLRFAKGIRHD